MQKYSILILLLIISCKEAKIERRTLSEKQIDTIIKHEDMVPLQGGKVSLGSDKNHLAYYKEGPLNDRLLKLELPIFEVELSPFLADKYEFSIGKFQALPLNEFPKEFNAYTEWLEENVQTYPTFLSFYQAVLICNHRSKKYNLDTSYTYTLAKPHIGRVILDSIQIDTNAIGFRLPTEAEWVYMAKAGDTANFLDSARIENELQTGKGIHLHPYAIAKKKPNAFGLYDVVGNSREWVEDQEYYGIPKQKKNPRHFPMLTRDMITTGAIIRGYHVLIDSYHWKEGTRPYISARWPRFYHGDHYAAMRCVLPLPEIITNE